MATPKLQLSRKQRAAEIPTENILPLLPDGRAVIIGKTGIHLTDASRCSCGDNRYGKMECTHMIAFVERLQ